MVSRNKVVSVTVSLALILVLTVSLFFFSSTNVKAQSYNSSNYNSYSNSYGTSSSYSNYNSSASSLLPSTGESVDPAQEQDWNQIMSQIEADTDEDEFTFSDKSDQSSTNYASKLFGIGILFIGLAVLGLWYLIYSNFFSKKCARNKNKVAAKQRVTVQSPARTAPKAKESKRVGKHQIPNYGDGYGYSKPKPNVAKKNINIDDYGINISSNSTSKNKEVSSKSKNTSNEIYSDSSFSTRELQKDAFWNDFFRKQ